MPKRKSPALDKERSPPRQPQLPLLSTTSTDPSHAPLLSTASIYPSPGEISTAQPTYSETILQRPLLAIDPSALPPQNLLAEGSPATSRRQSASSMRNASMTFESVTPSQTPTGRISKAKKGKRVHACEFPGCGKVFTRAEHRRRHELNHNPEAVYRCQHPGCGKSFHRLDLLQRHQERHEQEASPSLPSADPRHSSTTFPSPPSVLPSNTLGGQTSDSAQRTNQRGLPIGHLVNPPQGPYGANDSSIGIMFMPQGYNQTVDPYFYHSDGSQSPASDHMGRFHRQSISSASSVAAFDHSSLSPTMTTSMPGTWVPATAAPPVVLPSNAFEEGQTGYLQSPTVNPMPLHLRELDGHEFTTIQRELSNVPELIFDPSGPDLPRYIRFDCLDHYWKFFHPSFPIIYKPNFVTNTPPPLLLSAVIAIGSFYDHRPDAKHYSLALQEIATRLLRERGETITSRSRVADLQTVLLLEILSKYSARQSTPETSARFRGLFASLHQARQILVQNPLAVFRTLKQEKSDEDLKRAHKFWLEHEARRRIFHACTVLDAQQIALFGQRPTILTHGHQRGGGVNDVKGSIDLPCNEELWDASPLTVWASHAANTVPQDVKGARVNYHAASVDDYSFFQHQIINLNALSTQRCLEEAGSPPSRQNTLSKTRFNYHVFQMAKSIPVRALLIVTGETWFLGTKVEEAEYIEAKQKVRQWTFENSTAKGQTAEVLKSHWHALKLIRMLTATSESSQKFLSTNMLHEDWAVYLAALVCWARFYASTRPVQVGDGVSISHSPSLARKRKSTNETATPPRKRQVTTQAPASFAGDSPAMYSNSVSGNDVAYPSTAAGYNNAAWSAYGQMHNFGGQWAAYYDQSMTAYSHFGEGQTSAPSGTATTAEPSTLGSTLRTSSNTPLSQTSLATGATTALSSVPASDDYMADFRAYLSTTEVSSADQLSTIDANTLLRTKGLLEAIRLHKIGNKRSVSGLMNDAERVLSRLVEGRNNDMF